MSKDKISTREQLDTILSRPGHPLFLLIASPDTVRRNRVYEKIIDHYFSDLQLRPEVFKGTELRTSNSTRAIETAVQSTNLFSPVAVVVIEEAQALSADRTAELIAVLKQISDGACVLLLSDTLPAKSKLLTFCRKHDALIQLELLKGKDLTNWITRDLKNAGITRPPKSVVDGIATLSSGALDIAASIIEHIALYSPNGDITHEEFELLYPEAPQQNEFELIDLLQNGSAGEVEIALQRLWENGKNAFMFLSLLTRTYTRYITIRSLLDQGKAPAAIRHITGMKEWVFNKHLGVARRRSFSVLQEDMAALLRADSQLKNKSLGAPEVIAELAARLRGRS